MLLKKRQQFSANIKARKLLVIPGILLLLCFVSCTPGKKRDIEPAFYYWRTNFRISSYEQNLLTDIHATTLYLRLFDIDWKEQEQAPLPIGVLQSLPLKDSSLQYVPVVYITQRCLLRMEAGELPAFAAKIAGLMQQLCDRYHITPSELQIDCDWTQTSSGLYFKLLRSLKQQPYFIGKLLSCTIRMHQVKYAVSSGVPPADRGMLMVYNMGNLTRYGAHNSILELKEAKDYLKNAGQYPLPLDIALPVYHWAALFKEKKFKGIVYNIAKEDFNAVTLDHNAGNLYRIRLDARVKGYTFTAGEEIRFEQPSVKDVCNIASFLSDRLKEDKLKISFFHLDSFALAPFDAENISGILNTFR